MKKKTKFIIGIVAVILISIIVSISIYFYNINNQENKVSAIGMYTLNYWIEENFQPNEEDKKTAQNTTITKSELLEYLEDLKSQGKIKDYRENPHCIAIDLINGGTFMYTLDLPNGLQASSIVGSSEKSVKRSLDTISPLSVLTAQPNNSSLSSTVFDDSATLIENANIGYKFASNIDDSSVNLEFLKTLSQYKVIIWDGHGGYDSVRHSYFQIAETWTDETIGDYNDDVSAGRLVPLQDYTFAVTSAFFEENYEDDSFNDTLIYLGCCDGAMDPVLSDTLIKKGAESVLAYNNAVYCGYNRDMCETIFNELIKKDGNANSTKTVAEALETAKKQNGEKDPTSKRAWFEANYKNKDYRAELMLTENDDNSFRLVDENKKEDIKTSTTENESTIIKETTTKERITENDLKNELLNYYWENNFGETNIYDFSNDNTVVIYYGDFSSSKSSWSIIMKINYSIKNDELFLDWYNNGKYDIKLDYITKTQNNNLDRSLNFYNALDNDEYFFYDTDHTDGFQNAIYLKKGAKKEDTKIISEFDIYQPILKDYYNNCKKEHSIYNIHSFCKYTLYDIDENGVNELIVQSGTSEGDRIYYVYTCENNQSKLLGEYNAWHLGLYGSNKKIIAVDGMGGNWTIYNIIISNDEVVKKEIKTVESADSPTYSNKLDFYELYDYSIFNS